MLKFSFTPVPDYYYLLDFDLFFSQELLLAKSTLHCKMYSRLWETQNTLAFTTVLPLA